MKKNGLFQPQSHELLEYVGLCVVLSHFLAWSLNGLKNIPGTLANPCNKHNDAF